MSYKIVRGFRDSFRKYTIHTGLTLAEAQEHCRDPETIYKTCTSATGRRRTKKLGPWFDGYSEE